MGSHGPQARFDDVLEPLSGEVAKPVHAVARTLQYATVRIACELLARDPVGDRIGCPEPAGSLLGEHVEGRSARWRECHHYVDILSGIRNGAPLPRR
jgi:hypothetical protein